MSAAPGGDARAELAAWLRFLDQAGVDLATEGLPRPWRPTAAPPAEITAQAAPAPARDRKSVV